MSEQPTNIQKESQDFRSRLIPLRQAARQANKRYQFIRDEVNAGRLRAFRAGGSDKHPRLMVLPEDVEAVVRRSMLWQPRAKTRAGRTRVQKTHPKVTC